MPKYYGHDEREKPEGLTPRMVLDTLCVTTLGGLAGSLFAYSFGKATGLNGITLSKLTADGYLAGAVAVGLVTVVYPQTSIEKNMPKK